MNDFNNFQNKKYLKLAKNNNFILKKFCEIFVDDTKNIEAFDTNFYQTEGVTPVIDQGKNFIAGYVDQAQKEYLSPRILFGDHTRIIKYIDFPFFRGADGTKVFKIVNNNYDLKYLYYYLNFTPVPNNGYSRHFKFLKQLLIPVPSLKRQQQIADALDLSTELIEKRKEQINEMNKLIKSIYNKMFIDFIRNGNTVELGSITNHISSGNTPKGGSSIYRKDGIPFIRSQNILMNKIDYSDIVYIDDVTHGKMRRSMLKKNDILLNITGASIGRVAVFNNEDESANTNQHVASIRLKNNNFSPIFISYFLASDFQQAVIMKESSGGTREALNYQQIKKFRIPNISLDLQNKFVAIVEEIENQKEVMESSLMEMENNYNSLMQKAFKGELFPE